MRIEDNIIDAVNISRASKVPVLFLSNPGLGKTTILSKYAKKNGYCLETLIGSRFTPEEISGFFVNRDGIDHLVHMNPEWFSRIWENKKNGLPTLLFVDELSTCSEYVQGSLLSLIFDRTIGNGKFLPEDCLIVSAANYAANLSTFMNILAPTINRFVLVNLNDEYSPLDLIDEFLTDEDGPASENRVYTLNPMSEKDEKVFINFYRDFWKNAFLKYSDPESALGILDISNQNLGGIYTNSEKFIYNFISGRTLAYLRRVLKAYIELGIDNTDLFNKLIDGLVGCGTFSFADKKQETNYRKFIHSNLSKLTKIKKQKKIEMNVLSKDISKDVASFLMNFENLNTSADEDLRIALELVAEIKEQFSFENIMTRVKTSEEIAKFAGDMESIIEFQHFISKFPKSSNMAHELSKICFDFYGLYCDVLGIKPDFENTFGFNSKFFERVCFIKRKDSNGKILIERGALRKKTGKGNQMIYKLKDDQSLLEANLSEYYHLSDKFTVLVFDSEFKFIKIEDYCSLLKKSA